MAMKRVLKVRRPQAAPPRPEVSCKGIVYRLPGEPISSSPTFPCPICGSPIFDGSISRIAQCDCQFIARRCEDGSLKVKRNFSVNSFEDLFSAVVQVPEGVSEVLPLATVTFGVFEESLREEHMTDGRCDFSKVVRTSLAPWLMSAQRCLGVNDLVEVAGLKFKVLASHPFFGYVVGETEIMCYKTLTMSPVSELNFIVLKPFREEDIREGQIFLPFLFAGPRHVHLNQYIYINGVESIVNKCEPDNGLAFIGLNPSLASRKMDPLFELVLSPYSDSLPADPHVNLLDDYVRPFFSGWRRLVEVREEYDIGGVSFKSVSSSSSTGFVSPFTLITLQNSPLDRESELQNDNFMRMLRNSVPHSFAEFEQRKLSENLPAHVLESLPQGGDNSNCVICQDDFQLGESVKTLPCFHIFHDGCIDKWLKKSKECPICMHAVDELTKSD